MIDWIKPNGTEVSTNDLKATVEYCEVLGWKRKQEEDKPKRTRRNKEQMAADKAAEH